MKIRPFNTQKQITFKALKQLNCKKDYISISELTGDIFYEKNKTSGKNSIKKP